jgi:hypothetical protein
MVEPEQSVHSPFGSGHVTRHTPSLSDNPLTILLPSHWHWRQLVNLHLLYRDGERSYENDCASFWGFNGLRALQSESLEFVQFEF